MRGSGGSAAGGAVAPTDDAALPRRLIIQFTSGLTRQSRVLTSTEAKATQAVPA